MTHSTLTFASPGGVGLLAAVGGPSDTREVTSIVALLVVLGLALVMLAVWLFRSTRPDHELLAPLEVMGERSWRRGDPVWQRRRLDAVRPDGAQPLVPSASPPDLDEAFDAGPIAVGFDDLHDDPRDGAHLGRRNGDVAESTPAPDSASTSPAVSPAVPVAAHATPIDRGLEVASPGAPTAQPALPGLDRAPVVAPAVAHPQVAARSRPSAATTGLERPSFDDLPPGDIDPEVLAAAMAELDAELASPQPPPPAAAPEP